MVVNAIVDNNSHISKRISQITEPILGCNYTNFEAAESEVKYPSMLIFFSEQFLSKEWHNKYI